MQNTNKFESEIEICKMGFVLTYKNKYTIKDQYKADISNKFIGFSIDGRATWQYSMDAKAQNIPVNCSIYCSDDVVFVSINGIGHGTLENFNKTTTEIDLALRAGATIITDNSINANRAYNKHAFGESGLRAYLQQNYPNAKETDLGIKPYSIWTLTTILNEENKLH